MIIRIYVGNWFFISAFLNLNLYFTEYNIIRLFISFVKYMFILLISLLFGILVSRFNRFYILDLLCNFIIDFIFMLIIFSCFEYDLSFYSTHFYSKLTIIVSFFGCFYYFLIILRVFIFFV